MAKTSVRGPTLIATERTWKEVSTAIATGVCGHPPDPLSKEAKRLYRRMLKCEFKFYYSVVDTGKQGWSEDAE